MLKYFAFLFIFVALIGTSSRVNKSKRIFATVDSDTYRAAAVQYYPTVEKTGNETLEVNVNNYEQILALAADNEIDVIVFPEFGLSGPPMDKRHIESLRVKMYQKDGSTEIPHINIMKVGNSTNVTRSKEALFLREFYKNTAIKIPNPINKTNPCISKDAQHSQALKTLSCAAQEAQMYVVVNLYELVDCEINCEPDSFYLYNTNVVFDREGTIIARYRKYNIHGEPWADRTNGPLEAVFKTDFNVKFGVLIGLDLLKYGITQLYTREFTRTRDILLSTHPYDEMPFLNSKHDQASFAFKENKNLIAAGFSRDGGSGIYVGQYGWLEFPAIDWKKNYLMYADIPKLDVDSCKRSSQFGLLYAEELKDTVTKNIESHEIYGPSVLVDFEKDITKYLSSNYMATKPLDLEQDWFKERLCVGDVCCYFEVHMDTNPDDLNHDLLYRYRAMVFNGPYRFADGSWFRIETCAIIACAGDKEEDCGKDHRSIEKKNATTFSTILITRQAITNGSSFFGPLVSSKDEDGFPLRINNDYAFSDNINVHRVNFRYPYALFLLLLLKPASQIEIFGINGRRFDVLPPKDFHPDSDISLSILLIVIMAMVIILLCVFGFIYYRKKRDTRDPASVTEEGHELLPEESGIWQRVSQSFSLVFLMYF